MLSLAIAMQRFQSITRRSAKKVQSLRSIELGELSHGNRGNLVEATAFPALEQFLSITAVKTADHQQ
jgi:hypothetical protein